MAALIKFGKPEDFTIIRESRGRAGFSSLRSYEKRTPTSRTAASFARIGFPAMQGLQLESLTLTRNFEPFWDFGKKNEIYFLSWAWDMSGAPVYRNPNEGFDPEIYRMKPGQKKFPDAIMYPAKENIVGGLVHRIILMESDKGIRDAGKIMRDVSEAVSQAVSVALPAAGDPTGAVATTLTITKVAARFLSVVGSIMSINKDDFVDLFEGYFPAGTWKGKSRLQGKGCTLVLQRL